MESQGRLGSIFMLEICLKEVFDLKRCNWCSTVMQNSLRCQEGGSDTYRLRKHSLVIILEAICQDKKWEQPPINLLDHFLLLSWRPRLFTGICCEDLDCLIVMQGIERRSLFQIFDCGRWSSFFGSRDLFNIRFFGHSSVSHNTGEVSQSRCNEVVIRRCFSEGDRAAQSIFKPQVAMASCSSIGTSRLSVNISTGQPM